MLVHNLVVTGSLTFPTALPISGSLLVSGSTTFSGSVATNGNITINKTSPNIFMRGGYTQDLGFFLNSEPAVYIVDDATATKGIKVNISTGAFTQLGGGSSSFSGSVGIGTTSIINASAKLEVKGDLFVTSIGSAASKIHLYNNDSTNETYIYDSGSSSTSILAFAPGGATKMVVKSSGDVGIGSSTTNLSGNALNLTIIAPSTDSGGVLELAASNLTNTTGELGKIEFIGLNGSNTIQSRALIVSNQQGTTTSSNMRFYTMTGGTIAERMRILANGNVCIQDSFVDNGAKLCITSGAKAGMRIIADDTYLAISIGGTGNFWMDYPGVGGGRFQVDANGNTYNRTGVYGTVASDLRLKENIVDASSKLEDILKLRVVNFNLTNDLNKKKNIGFIAQELKEVFPSFVYESDTREYDEEGNLISGFEDAMGIKVGMEFAILVKAVQEQQATINALTTRITALEN